MEGVKTDNPDDPSTKNILRNAKSLFKRLDEDGNGELTVEEFVQGCKNNDELQTLLRDTEEKRDELIEMEPKLEQMEQE